MIKRYLLPEIEQIFSREKKFKTWVQVEVEVAKAEEAIGIIPEGTVLKLSEQIASLDIQRVMELTDKLEEETDHEVVAFLMALENILGEPAKYLHFGMTSSDLLDTANAIILKDAVSNILDELELLINTLRLKIVETKYIPIMGRTHGVYAEPTSLGLKLLSFYSEFLRNRERITRTLAEISYGKVSGAVGNYSLIPPEVEEQVLAKLGLKPEPVSTQIVPRDRYAFVISSYALLAENIERFAQEIRLLQRTGTSELREPFSDKQRGSSAMPHKRNPIKCERLMGMARLMRGYLIPSHENIALWDERDISHSSVERIILPDASCLLFYMIRLMRTVVEGLYFDTKKIKENIDSSGGFYLSEPLLLAIVSKGVARKDAYVWVKEAAIRSQNEGISFAEAVAESSDIKKILTDDEIRRALSHNFLRNIDKIYKRFGL